MYIRFLIYEAYALLKWTVSYVHVYENGGPCKLLTSFMPGCIEKAKQISSYCIILNA